MNKELFWLKIRGLKKQADADRWSEDNPTPITDWRRGYTDPIGRFIGDVSQATQINPALSLARAGVSGTVGGALHQGNNLIVQPLLNGSSDADNSFLGWLANSVEDLGKSIGEGIGDVAAKLNDKPTKYHGTYAGIVDLLNDKEQVALYKREARRLLRRARIAYRKKLLKGSLADKAVRSPFI